MENPTSRPIDVAALEGHAGQLIEQGRIEEATQCLRRLCARPDARPNAWFRLLMLLEMQGKVEEAAAALGEARRRLPPNPGFTLMEAKILRRQEKIEQAIAVLEPAAKRVSGGSRIPFQYELGQLYDRVNACDKAFDCFLEANRGAAESPPGRRHDNRQTSEALKRIRREFRPFGDVSADPERAAPVFLIGFPRSGTTLLDQIISSCPSVRVAEERSVISNIGARLFQMANPDADTPWFVHPDYPALLYRAKEEDLAAARRFFWREHGLQPEGILFTDKMPLNLMHAGIIRKVFPQAKFILALRHPCDVVLSCFMQEFHLNPFMARFLDLSDAAHFYDEAFSLWDHYTKILDLDVHVIRYEDVVADFRPTAASLLDFLGLEWTDAVLEFDKTARGKTRINTPSYRQVTQKIYTRSSGRWLRYRKHMESVLPILEPWVLKHGYSMEPTGTED
ncbi:MAG: tetratricopeptide repeat protein [Alphaproteobacteria bacterium]|nr:MAG: tetratricopeptide repeat protein [Alphaproteobacteria bacterium]